MGEEKKLPKSVSGYSKTKKNPMAIKLEGGGGGKALMDGHYEKNFFCGYL